MFGVFDVRTGSFAHLDVNGVRSTVAKYNRPLTGDAEKNLLSLKPGQYCYHAHFVIFASTGGVTFNSREFF